MHLMLIIRYVNLNKARALYLQEATDTNIDNRYKGFVLLI